MWNMFIFIYPKTLCKPQDLKNILKVPAIEEGKKGRRETGYISGGKWTLVKVLVLEYCICKTQS